MLNVAALVATKGVSLKRLIASATMRPPSILLGHRCSPSKLPGLEEKDVDVELANGVLAIRGEKKTETEDKNRLFSERYYGRFERRIPIDDVEEDKVTASFKNGALTVTLPKIEIAQAKVKRIAINGR